MLYLFIKRLFDIIISLIGIVITILLSIIIKIIFVLSGDFHSIYFSHYRIGKDGKIFKLYKFRSMVYNADKVLNDLLKDDNIKKEWYSFHKLKNDPRITPIGKILRKTSIDEFPQFFNIFIGDMSLVGPRPLVNDELNLHNGNHDLYESVRPGLTSWWVCNGHNSISYEERLSLEYYYIENRSLLLDFKCILKTFYVVFDKIMMKLYF